MHFHAPGGSSDPTGNRAGMADLERALAEACEAAATALDIEGLVLRARYDRGERRLVVTAFGPDSEEIRERTIELFHDFVFHLPAGLRPDDRYRLELTTQEEGRPARRLVLESAYALLPDTGGVGRAEWQAFTSQLVYTIDGQPCQLEPPDDFLED